jgi:hypothetical protein
MITRQQSMRGSGDRGCDGSQRMLVAFVAAGAGTGYLLGR